jgi:hypothetical protein
MFLIMTFPLLIAAQLTVPGYHQSAHSVDHHPLHLSGHHPVFTADHHPAYSAGYDTVHNVGHHLIDPDGHHANYYAEILDNFKAPSPRITSSPREEVSGYLFPVLSRTSPPLFEFADNKPSVQDMRTIYEGKTVSHEDKGLSLEDKAVSRENKTESSEDKAASHEDNAVSREDTAVSLKVKSASHEDEVVIHEDKILSHEDKAVSYKVKSLSREDKAVSHKDNSLSHENRVTRVGDNLWYGDKTTISEEKTTSVLEENLLFLEATQLVKVTNVPCIHIHIYVIET